MYTAGDSLVLGHLDYWLFRYPSLNRYNVLVLSWNLANGAAFESAD